MLRSLGRVFADLSYSAWRRKKLLLFLTVLIVIGSAVAVYGYAVHQWHAAQTALKEDRPAEARKWLGLCLFVWPRSLDVQLLAARAARLTGDVDAAESHLNRCLKLHNGATEAVQLEFLLLRVQTGDVDEIARSLLDAVENGHPESPIILETLARAYINRLRYKMAYACLSRWIELRPDTAKAYQWRGWTLEQLDNPKSASADYHRALDIDPNLIPVRLRVAEMLLHDKRLSEAAPHLERLYHQAPDRPEVLSRLGICRFIQGRAEEARRLLEAAVVQLPNDPEVLVHLAMLDIHEGRGVEAEQWLRKVLRADPADTEALFNLAAALRLQGRSDEAAAVLREHERYKELVDRANDLIQNKVDKAGAGPDTASEIGNLMLQMGRDKVGLYWMDQALLKDPGHQPTHEILAKYYERRGEMDQAAAHRRQIKQSVKSAPSP
jgi:tetratricopeptide (TPR) repeat protein